MDRSTTIGGHGRPASKQAERDEVDTLTALVPASTDTRWFQNYYANADILTFIQSRIGFEGAGDSKASFPSVIATWGEVPDEYFRALHKHGFVTHVSDFELHPVADPHEW